MMVENTSYMFVTGPNVVKTVTNETVTAEELGGASTHSTKSGVAHTTSANDVECLEDVKKLLSYLPQNNQEVPQDLPYTPTDEIRETLNRSEERRVGKECRSRWSRYHERKEK